MTRRLLLSLVALALAMVPPATLARAASPLDDLMMDLNIAPLAPAAAPALTVTTEGGSRVSLADMKGRAVLIYFWATW
jgi:cytochrome oxidase Cu insertion factor (SCO1/SenC/PrrC family)